MGVTIATSCLGAEGKSVRPGDRWPYFKCNTIEINRKPGGWGSWNVEGREKGERERERE